MEQSFLTFRIHGSYLEGLLKHRVPGPPIVSDPVALDPQECAFLTSSLVMLTLLIWGP